MRFRYANVSLVPRTVTNFKTPQPRLLAMIVARFVTGVGTGTHGFFKAIFNLQFGIYISRVYYNRKAINV